MIRPVDSTADLRVLFRSRHPLLVVEAADEERLLALVRRPLSVSRAEDIASLRAWAAERAVPAD